MDFSSPDEQGVFTDETILYAIFDKETDIQSE
jgi:hypothetical protein